MISKLSKFFLVSCLATSALSLWVHESEEDDDCYFAPALKNNQRISEQKCEVYKKFTYKEYPTTGSCKPHKSYKCVVPKGLVSNGLECDENEFPHMAHVGYETNGVRSYRCGGTLISEFFVLTAAHCEKDKERKLPNIVRLNSVSEDSPQAIFRNIVEIIVHPDYKANKANDLALLKLSEKVNFQLGRVRPACLWTKDRLENDTATITGWGATSFADGASNHLLQAKLDLVDIGKCKNALGERKVHDEYHICATDLTGTKKDACQGDSGGPLQVLMPADNPCMAYVIGVVSRGSACGVPNSHGIYVKVSKFIDWIEKIVWKVLIL